MEDMLADRGTNHFFFQRVVVQTDRTTAKGSNVLLDFFPRTVVETPGRHFLAKADKIMRLVYVFWVNLKGVPRESKS
jgi:hypothetical protein